MNTIYKGACGGELACSTCHLVFEESIYKTLPEKEEEEIDMLDLAFDVTETYVLRQKMIPSLICDHIVA
jgi:ferredoxin-2, mitochondrial